MSYRIIGIINAIETAMESLTIANGYSLDLPAANIKPVDLNSIISLKQEDFPLVAVLYYDEAFEYVSQTTHEVTGNLFIQGYRTQNSTPSTRREDLLKFGQDIKKVLAVLQDDMDSGAVTKPTGFLGFIGGEWGVSYWPTVWEHYDMVQIEVPVKYDEIDTET